MQFCKAHQSFYWLKCGLCSCPAPQMAVLKKEYHEAKCPDHADGGPCGTGRSLRLRGIDPDAHLGAVRA